MPETLEKGEDSLSQRLLALFFLYYLFYYLVGLQPFALWFSC